MDYYSQNSKNIFLKKKSNILNLIREIVLFGVFEYEITKLIDLCKNLFIDNQYFKNIIDNLESRPIYSIDDIYILEDVHKIQKFLKNYNE
jgi:hypothetical protein